MMRLWVMMGLCLVVTAPAVTSEWPVYRGDHGLRGVAGETLGDVLVRRWTYRAQRAITGSAVVRDGRVYAASRDGDLHIINLADGSPIQRWPLAAGAKASPAIHDQIAVITLLRGVVQAISLEDGSELWRTSAEDAVKGAVNIWPGNDDAPPLVVFCSDDFSAYAHDLRSGERRWQVATGNYLYGGPAIAAGRAVFGGCDSFLYVVDLASGEKQGGVALPSYMQSSPAVDWPYAFTGTGDQTTGEFIAADLARGEILWRYGEDGGPYVAIPAVNDEVVVFGDQDMILHCLDRRTGAQRWTFVADDSIDAAPTIAGNRVVACADNGIVYLIDLTSGRELARFDCGSPITGGAAVAGGLVLVGTRNGTLHAFSTSADDR